MSSKRKSASRSDDSPSTIAPPGPPKRQRVSRACDQCRAAREKCDGIAVCTPCAAQRRACTYKASPKKRGVPTGYIRALEVALALAFDKYPGSEDTLMQALGRDEGRSKSIRVGGSSESADRLHRRWMGSSVCSAIDAILSGKEPARRAASTVASDPETSDSGADVDTRAEGSGSGPSMAATALLSPNSQRFESTQPTSQYALPGRIRWTLPPNYQTLLDVYFSYTHSWFPILEKHDVLKTGYAYSEDGLDVSLEDATSAVHAELWSVLALASCQYEASLVQQQRTSSAAMHPGELYKRARSLIPIEDGQFNIHHLRSLLLLTLVNLGSDNIRAAWMLIGHAVRIAFDLGLGMADDAGKLRPRDRRAFMGCFVLDTLVACRAGRPSHLTGENFPDAAASSIEDIDEWEPWQPPGGFCSGVHGQRQGPLIPAKALSTFDTIYHLCMQLARSSATGAGPTHVPIGSSEVTPYQYQPFVADGDEPPSRLPSPYVPRLLQLALRARRGLHAVSALQQMLQHIRIYETQHGLPAMPPLFTTLLGITRGCCGPGSLLIDDVGHLETLDAGLTAIWRRGTTSTIPSFSETQMPSLIHVDSSNPRPGTNTASPGYPVIDAMLSNPFYSIPRPSGPEFMSRGAGGFYSGMPTAQGLGGSSEPAMNPGGTEHANMDPATGMLGGTAVAGLLAQPVQFQSGASFGADPIDYDALYDNLANSEDRIGAETQFMANMGIGADISAADLEQLRREFGLT